MQSLPQSPTNDPDHPVPAIRFNLYLSDARNRICDTIDTSHSVFFDINPVISSHCTPARPGKISCHGNSPEMTERSPIGSRYLRPVSELGCPRMICILGSVAHDLVSREWPGRTAVFHLHQQRPDFRPAHGQGRKDPVPALVPYQDRRREDLRAGTLPLRRMAMPAACTQTIDKSRLPSREELLRVRQAMFDSAIALSDQCP